MEKPSLEIGNSNWAIKEGELLGYNRAGNDYLPIPITMTRASLGTRVNPEGLVEDVELLGSELVVNGDFATDSDWNKTGTWSIESNYATASGNSTSQYIQQDFTITNGKTYLFTYEIIENTLNGNGSSLSGSGGFVSVSLSSVIGTHQVYITADDSGAAYALKIGVSGTATTGTIKLDNVSVKEVTRDGLARVDYDGTASSLLVEPLRTNLINYSSDFSESSWTKLAAGSGIAPIVTSDYSISPDGTQTADRIQFNLNGGTGGGDTSYINTSLSAGTINASASIYLKTNDNTTKDITLRLGAGLFDYDVTVTSEWQRFSLLGNTNVDRMQLLLYGNKNSQTADLSVWGAQVESGSYATSYIPTDGSTVTRVQDQYEKTGISNLIGQTEGTFFIELSKPVLNFSTQSLISLNNAASNSDANSIAIGFDAGDDFFIRLQSNNVFVFQETETNADANTFYKIAVSYKSTESLIYIDGSPITPNGGSLSNAFTFTATLDNLSFDFNGNNSLPFYGKVKQLQVYNTALTDTELATLTQ